MHTKPIIELEQCQMIRLRKYQAPSEIHLADKLLLQPDHIVDLVDRQVVCLGIFSQHPNDLKAKRQSCPMVHV